MQVPALQAENSNEQQDGAVFLWCELGVLQEMFVLLSVWVLLGKLCSKTNGICDHTVDTVLLKLIRNNKPVLYVQYCL